MPHLRVLPAGDLTPEQLREIRALLDSAFGDRFSDEDWAHSLGGTHILLVEGPTVVAHASVVPRLLEVDGRPVAAGYVEAVATLPTRQGAGLGSAVMTEAGAVVRRAYALGALSTSRHTVYERLGWERWLGPTYVRDGVDLVRTEDEDAGVMVLRFEAGAAVDLRAALSCETRSGDDW